MIDLSQELEKLSHYYDSEMIIDKYTMAPVYEFIHKKTLLTCNRYFPI